MRYINSSWYNSVQLYKQILLSSMTYEEYKEFSLKNSIDIQKKFSYTIDRYFRDNIWYIDSLKRLIFDPNGNINYLDGILYEELRELVKRCEHETDSMFDEVYNVANLIAGRNSAEIKELAKLKLHDAVVLAFNQEGSTLKMVVLRYNDMITYSFEAVEIQGAMIGVA